MFCILLTYLLPRQASLAGKDFVTHLHLLVEVVTIVFIMVF